MTTKQFFGVLAAGLLMIQLGLGGPALGDTSISTCDGAIDIVMDPEATENETDAAVEFLDSQCELTATTHGDGTDATTPWRCWSYGVANLVCAQASSSVSYRGVITQSGTCQTTPEKGGGNDEFNCYRWRGWGEGKTSTYLFGSVNVLGPNNAFCLWSNGEVRCRATPPEHFETTKYAEWCAQTQTIAKTAGTFIRTAQITDCDYGQSGL